MSRNINLEASLRDFYTQRYPTAEQTINNNASVLYKRKKFFLEELRHSFKFTGFVVLVIIYLRDLSMFRFSIRAFTQYSISNPFPSPNPRFPLSDENKKALTKFLLLVVLAGNGFCFLMHMIFGIYTPSGPSEKYLYGGMSLQFIGERFPYSTVELLILDLIVCAIQLVYHSLVCVSDDSKILETKIYDPNDISNEGKPHYDGDGYSGDVHLLTIDVLRSAYESLQIQARFQFNTNLNQTINNTATATEPAAPAPATAATAAPTMPGSFAAAPAASLV